MKILKILFHILIVSLLTIVTQVGGLIWIAVFGFFKLRKSTWNKRRRVLVFSLVYILMITTVVPWTASLNNRRMLPVFNEEMKPHNLGYVLLCRNYVNDSLWINMNIIASNHFSQTGNQLVYLDAGFPFIDGFPLLPHLSHNDGKKVDIAFEYKTKDGKDSFFDHPSLLGYGIYEEPLEGEINQPEKCKKAGFWQYDYAKYLGVRINNDLVLDGAQTKHLIKETLKVPDAQKIFIEPHLIKRLELNLLNSYNRDKIRFHGCHAVRHDDHIHFQIK